MSNIPIGTTHSVQVAVTPENTARALGSGLVDVFATPAMVTQMELAASGLAAPYLEAGQVTVGTSLNVGHTAATPVGGTITTTATLTKADGRILTFEVKSEDDAGEVGGGTHTRVIVEEARFLSRAQGRTQKDEQL